MVDVIKDNMKWIKNMAMENSSGKPAANTKDTMSMMLKEDMAKCTGSTAAFIVGSGSTEYKPASVS